MPIILCLLFGGLSLAGPAQPATPAGSRPTIASFTATPAKITAGQSSTLSWVVTGSPTVSINLGVGTVTGTSATVRPSATTSYTLAASNGFGTITATAMVTVIAGSKPAIASFTAAPSMVTAGAYSTLGWTVAGSPTPTLSINSGVGSVTGTALSVKVQATTTYTLTATNPLGTATATVTVTAGTKPAITSFTATPAQIAAGQSVTLNWVVTGTPGLIINPGVGPVSGTSAIVKPTATTTYTLSATNSFGTSTSTATATLLPPLPVIGAFLANPATVGPGIGTKLLWQTSGAASLSIDHGVGTVTGSSVTVSPAAATTYKLTATNAAGSVTATAAVGYMPLIAVTSQLHYSEHVLFIIPPPNQVNWSAADTWDSVFSAANVNSYVSTLKSLFPSDYFFVVVAANNLTPNNVPSVQPLRRTADGIGLGSTGVGVPSICRYNIGGGTVIEGAFGVLDHEIGHNWGIFLQPELSDANGHWYANSTAIGQMAGTYSDDGYVTVKQIAGNPVTGFTWAAINNIQKNETETFSAQDLYLQGLAPTFPDVYVLTAPAYHADHTVTYSSVAKYDENWMVQKHGVRVPSYQTSPKRLRMGVIYIARDMAEVLAAYQPIERSIDNFVNGEQIDTTNFRFQVPFLVDTQYRASLDALLADLDGNKAPTLTIPGSTSLVSGDGSATVRFTAADPDGSKPVVSCVPASANCSIVGTNVVLKGLPLGANFITIKAQDAGGKKDFAHFVVDVQ